MASDSGRRLRTSDHRRPRCVYNFDVPLRTSSDCKTPEPGFKKASPKREAFSFFSPLSQLSRLCNFSSGLSFFASERLAFREAATPRQAQAREKPRYRKAIAARLLAARLTYVPWQLPSWPVDRDGTGQKNSVADCSSLTMHGS
jgi:hypothetical protein